VYQTSTMGRLLDGVYDGDVTLRMSVAGYLPGRRSSTPAIDRYFAGAHVSDR
jgi:hypothetical protein